MKTTVRLRGRSRNSGPLLRAYVMQQSMPLLLKQMTQHTTRLF